MPETTDPPAIRSSAELLIRLWALRAAETALRNLATSYSGQQTPEDAHEYLACTALVDSYHARLVAVARQVVQEYPDTAERRWQIMLQCRDAFAQPTCPMCFSALTDTSACEVNSYRCAECGFLAAEAGGIAI